MAHEEKVMESRRVQLSFKNVWVTQGLLAWLASEVKRQSCRTESLTHEACTNLGQLSVSSTGLNADTHMVPAQT